MSNILEAYLRHEVALKKYLYRFVKRPQDVEDIAQETFIKVFATEIRTEIRHPKALLFRAAKHAALSALSRKANTEVDFIEEIEDREVFTGMVSGTAEDVHDARRKLAALSMAVAGLPPVCRRVFVLRKIEGLSMKEIAARLKISVSTAEKHAAEGLVKCSRHMQEMGYGLEEFGAELKTVRRKRTNRVRRQQEEATASGEQKEHN